MRVYIILENQLKKMADADFFIGIDIGYDTDYNGCWLENQAAERYNLNRYLFNIDKIHFTEEDNNNEHSRR